MCLFGVVPSPFDRPHRATAAVFGRFHANSAFDLKGLRLEGLAPSFRELPMGGRSNDVQPAIHHQGAAGDERAL